MELDTLTFNILLRDSLCLKYAETEEGQKHLNECWRFKQQEPDLEGLQNFGAGRFVINA